jgi:hypothetical protein
MEALMKFISGYWWGWWGRPSNYDESRLKFFKKMMIVLAGLIIINSILCINYKPNQLILLGILAIVVIYEGTRGRSKSVRKKFEDWWTGKSSKWSIFNIW